MDTLILDNSLKIKEAKEKAVAILKLILGGDEVAAEYLLVSVLSRVHTRQSGLILGNVPLNLSGVSPQ